jgi:hypothetical protein
MNQYRTGTGQLLGKVHNDYECRGPYCVIHNPAPGPWNNWPTHWRGDEPFDIWRGFERICPHGVGHPAVEEPGSRVHGCDGCPCGPLNIGLTEEAIMISGRKDPQAKRPLDYNKEPARTTDELTLQDRFMIDQEEAIAEDVLTALIHTLMRSVLHANGDHPGRTRVSTEWLAQMSALSEVQVRAILQFACWHLAEMAVLGMERDGTLAKRYGIKLGEGWDLAEE